MAVFVVFALMIAAAGCGSDRSGSEGTNVRTRADYLMVLTAESGTYRTGELTLQGVGDSTLLFADRPRRDVRNIPTEAFIDRWDRTFGSDPPNASIAVLEGRSRPRTVILEVDDPTYDASSRTLTFASSPLGAGTPPANLRAVSITIDESETVVHPTQY